MLANFSSAVITIRTEKMTLAMDPRPFPIDQVSQEQPYKSLTKEDEGHRSAFQLLLHLLDHEDSSLPE